MSFVDTKNAAVTCLPVETGCGSAAILLECAAQLEQPMETVLSRMGAMRRVLARTFKVRVVPVFAGLVWLCVRTTVSFFMALDPLFFGRLRRTKVKAPIVLVGQPRSGTTFLQRFLCDQNYGAGLEVWRMLYTSLTIQFFLKPILPLLEIVAPTRWHKTKAHDT